MKNIVVCIGNGLLSEAIIKMLQNSGEFKPFRLLVQKKSHIASDCEAVAADILLMDVSYASGTTMETRLKEVKQVRKKIPPCKLVMLHNENSAPEIPPVRESMRKRTDLSTLSALLPPPKVTLRLLWTAYKKVRWEKE